MKGIILAGGKGTRLMPLTKITSKQLLPIYNKPMIYYPIETLIQAGIKEILIVVSPDHGEDFMKLLGSGKEFGVRFMYEVQEKPEGIGQAFLIGETFIGQDDVVLLLGDNIFDENFMSAITGFSGGGMIFAKKVHDPKRFGVIEFDADGNVISIEEKPENPKSNFAQTGLYVCDNSVVEKAKSIKPSGRGELEITDIMKLYLEEKTLKCNIIDGVWYDTGTFDSMLEASNYMKGKE